MNADKLTMDAQSALRRCIELFSHNTRFFIVVEDKYKLLKPILSRFCEIYVPEVMVDGQPVNLYRHNVEAAFGHESEGEKRLEWLEKSISKMNTSKKNMDKADLYKQAAAYYEKGYSGLDVIQLLEDRRLVIDVSEEKRCEWLVAFHKVRKEIRNETLLIVFLLHFLFVDREKNLDNLSFM
jgi:DNA polymerase III delta prime subunit